MTSIIRSPEHSADILASSATPLVLSLESSTLADFIQVFEGTDIVVFSAGAGGPAGVYDVVVFFDYRRELPAATFFYRFALRNVGAVFDQGVAQR